MSAEQEPDTYVVFRRIRDAHRDVIALFPLIPEIGIGSCLSYMHVGQHGAACLALTGDTDHAPETDPDVAALKRELEQVGYRLSVHRRLPHWRRIAASREASKAVQA